MEQINRSVDKGDVEELLKAPVLMDEEWGAVWLRISQTWLTILTKSGKEFHDEVMNDQDVANAVLFWLDLVFRYIGEPASAKDALGERATCLLSEAAWRAMVALEARKRAGRGFGHGA